MHLEPADSTRRIKLRPEHIEHGMADDKRNHPIALALLDALKRPIEAGVSYTRFECYSTEPTTPIYVTHGRKLTEQAKSFRDTGQMHTGLLLLNLAGRSLDYLCVDDETVATMQF